MALFPAPSITELATAFPNVTNLVHIATGGFKHVYRATISGNVEAFKLLALPSVGTTDSEQAARREYIGRAQREIELLGSCTVPELVKLGSLAPQNVTIGGIDFLGYSEEFLSGESLVQYIQRGAAPPTEREAKKLFVALLRAIRQLWSFETVHRDIKPLNVVMLPDPGRSYVLLDLGIAYQTREPGLTINPATFPATLPYIAPEMLQINFRQSLDYRADIYTAAVTTFEYATFSHPLKITSSDPLRTISRVQRQPPTPLRSLRTDFSDSFCRVIDQSLKKSPPLRPGNLNLLIARLETEL